MSKDDDWVEVCWCTCGHKIIQDHKPFPHGLYGQQITCPRCKKEFVVCHAILRDRVMDDGLLELLTHEAYQLRQSIIEEFYE